MLDPTPTHCTQNEYDLLVCCPVNDQGRAQDLSKALQTNSYFELFFMPCEQSLKKLPPGLPSRTKCRSQTELLFAREQPFERLAKLSTGRQQKLRSIFVGCVVDGRQTVQKVQLKANPKRQVAESETYLSSFCDFRPSSRWCRLRKATQSETVADGLSRTRLPGLLSKLGVRPGNPNHVDRLH